MQQQDLLLTLACRKVFGLLERALGGPATPSAPGDIRAPDAEEIAILRSMLRFLPINSERNAPGSPVPVRKQQGDIEYSAYTVGAEILAWQQETDAKLMPLLHVLRGPDFELHAVLSDQDGLTPALISYKKGGPSGLAPQRVATASPAALRIVS